VRAASIRASRCCSDWLTHLRDADIPRAADEVPMTAVRAALALIAAVALLTLGAVVALAAPDAVGRAASPQAGAGRLEYCPAAEKKRRQKDLKWAQSRAAADRKTYFAKHPKAKDRNAFLRSQQARLKALQQAYANCN
jgi:hypothetical protein